MSTRNLNLPPPKAAPGYVRWQDSRKRQERPVGDVLHIGRDPANQIVLEDEFISARHARIERREVGYVLRDLRSRNGTTLNGSKVLEAMLADGDRIQIGCQELLFSNSKTERPEPPRLTSRNKRWAEQIARLPDVARSPFPLLITGPSGTGKDVLAQAIHRLSDRPRGPLIGVNCSALNETLVESELFGHRRGSFTGAESDRKGAFEAARGGTLFLDEVADLPLTLQPKLLRALENNQIRPVGSDHAVAIDTRIIAATHIDLKQLVQDGRFRPDLYFRLHVLQVHVPPLTERMEDFEDLLYGFAREMRVRFSYGAVARLKTHRWPGNIRELRNVVARARALYGGEEILDTHVEQFLDTLAPAAELRSGALTARSLIKEIEYEMIIARLRANQGNQRRTAADLGMAKSTLHDRIKTYGIDIERIAGRRF